MWLVAPFIYALSDAIDYLVAIHDEVSGWAWPFYLVADHFLTLAAIVSRATWDIWDFGVWLDGLIAQIEGFLSWETILSYIRSWLYWIGDLSTIFLYFVWNVLTVIRDWWADISLLVQGWIDDASAWLQSQLDNLTLLWISLQAAWDSFKDKIPTLDEIISWFRDWWGNIIATIINWGALTVTQIWDLIDSAIQAYAPFWEGWQDVRDQVIQFFTDPWAWLYARFDDFIERFW